MASFFVAISGKTERGVNSEGIGMGTKGLRCNRDWIAKNRASNIVYRFYHCL